MVVRMARVASGVRRRRRCGVQMGLLVLMWLRCGVSMVDCCGGSVMIGSSGVVAGGGVMIGSSGMGSMEGSSLVVNRSHTSMLDAKLLWLGLFLRLGRVEVSNSIAFFRPTKARIHGPSLLCRRNGGFGLSLFG